MPLELYHSKELLEVGIDEVARGCLLGRVYAAAVIWPQEEPLDSQFYPPIRDSKKLSPKKREQLKDFIETNAIAFGVSYATEAEIDRLNILGASQLAMHRALDKVREAVDFDHILVDGNYFLTYFTYTHNTFEVAEYPDLEVYGLLDNMGYGSQKHMDAIKTHGVTQFHRSTFKPCCGKQNIVKKNNS
jgi:ribonuclease HII